MIDKIMQYAIKLIFKLLWKNKNLRIDKVEKKWSNNDWLNQDNMICYKIIITQFLSFLHGR